MKPQTHKVYFVGAGPGAADLITLRGIEVLKSCDVCIYAGSLVPAQMLSHLPLKAKRVDSSSLTLDKIVTLIKSAHQKGLRVVRLHSGDPAIYGATAEQIRHLNRHHIPYEIVAGVNAFSAAAARMGIELTRPEVCQTVIITRSNGKAGKVGESLEVLAKSGGLLAIHLSVRMARSIAQQLKPILGESCPAIVAYNVSRPDELIIHTTLKELGETVKKARLTKTSIIFVGKSLRATDFPDSGLYSPHHHHIARPK